MTNKYNARKIEIDGYIFPSKREGNRYTELKLLERSGEITDLELQPRFVLLEAFTYNDKKMLPIRYTADFAYNEKGNDKRVIEEVKGKRTRDLTLRMKLFLHRYGDLYDYRII